MKKSDKRMNVAPQELREAQKLMISIGYSDGRISANAGMVALCIQKLRKRKVIK